ncbi:MAG: HAD hydrolase-like protein [Clostridiales bacterium]|jgi:phosphoglycolate phosphatase|nr:HAD hydrolase-like protein [Clostridiales bacterium]
MKHILFDLDGTLTDPKIGITRSVQYALESFGIDVALDGLTKFIGPPLRASFTNYFGFNAVQAEQAVVKYREYFSERGIFENRVYAGTPELLKKLKGRGWKIILATSKAEIYAWKILEHFTFVCGDTLDGSRSEKAAIIRRILNNVDGIKPGSAVMVGDREHDIMGAKANGMASIGVLYGYGDKTELTKAGALTPFALGLKVSRTRM